MNSIDSALIPTPLDHSLHYSYWLPATSHPTVTSPPPATHHHPQSASSIPFAPSSYQRRLPRQTYIACHFIPFSFTFNTQLDTQLDCPRDPNPSSSSFLSPSDTSRATLTMSYFTMSGSDYDLPHPTLSRHPPRFYIPDRSDYSPAPTSAGYAREPLSMHSRMPSASTLPYSGHSTPYHAESFYGSGSRSSIAALRHALQNYHQHAQARQPLTPQQQISRPPFHSRAPPGQHGPDSSPGEPSGELGDPTASLPLDLWGSRVGAEPLEALVDIHRVLYRGGEDPAETSAPPWSEQGREVKRVMDQWFEGDCGECSAWRVARQQTEVSCAASPPEVVTTSRRQGTQRPVLTPNSLRPSTRSTFIPTVCAHPFRASATLVNCLPPIVYPYLSPSSCTVPHIESALGLPRPRRLAIILKHERTKQAHRSISRSHRRVARVFWASTIRDASRQ